MVAGLVVGGGGVWFLTRRPAPSPPPAGVPLSLAQDRAHRVSDLRYRLSLTIPESRSEPVRGHLTASFELRDARQPLALDFAQPADHVSAIVINGHAADVRAGNGHLMMPTRRLQEGANQIDLDFVAGD